MAGNSLVDLVPDHDRQVFEYRRDLAESLAVQYSALEPEISVYRVTLHLVESPPRWNQAVRGTVLVKGPRISFAQRAWEQTARIFIRESGA